MSEKVKSSRSVVDIDNDAQCADVINQIKDLHHETYDQSLDEFQLLSTIRYDPNLTVNPPMSFDQLQFEHFYLLHDHVERIKYSLRFFTRQYLTKTKNEKPPQVTVPEISDPIIFQHLKSSLCESQISLSTPHKIRLLISFNGKVDVEFYEIPPVRDLLGGFLNLEPPLFDVYIDKQQVLASPFTSFKTTYRKVYTEARNRCLPGLKPGKEEVIVINTADEVMEGSITNIALKSNTGVWLTPQLTSGCLCGVMRSHLLQKKLLKEYLIYKQDLKPGTELLLFNAIMGVVKGKIIE